MAFDTCLFMPIRKIISVWALLALMIAQIAVAQHSAAHFDHGFESPYLELSTADHQDQNDDDDQEHETAHECPECLVTKSLSAAFVSDHALHQELLTGADHFYVTETPYVSARQTKPYNPRAPPAFLI